jgi:hypothetical protein
MNKSSTSSASHTCTRRELCNEKAIAPLLLLFSLDTHRHRFAHPQCSNAGMKFSGLTTECQDASKRETSVRPTDETQLTKLIR